MIDPLEAVLKWLQADAALAELVGSRIASKHRYGEGADSMRWSTDQASLTVRLDGGQPDLYVPLQNVRLEVRCYAPSQYLASRIWQRVVEVSRETSRQPVLTSGGAALLHRLNQESSASMLYDRDLGLDLVLVFLSALVGEEALT